MNIVHRTTRGSDYVNVLDPILTRASGGAQPCFYCISTYMSLYFVCRLIVNNNNNTLYNQGILLCLYTCTTKRSDYVYVPVQPGNLIMFMYLYNQGIRLCLCTCTTRGSDYVYVHCTNRGSDYVYVLVQPGDLIMFMYLYNQGI